MARIRLKRLRDQVIVLTGASSGIGLVTARMAAHRGAQLVLCSRDADALEKLTTEIQRKGGEAIFVPADVGNQAEVERVAEEAIDRFGRIDTWINDAGVSIYGRLEDVDIEDERRLFETNFWGTVYGSLAALKHMRRNGGAIINIGSVVSDVAIPLQGIYSASKQAVKGFTDALRNEVEQAGYPISVTLVKPPTVDTPYAQHAKNYMETEPTLPPPVYAPDIIADAILRCAERPERDVLVTAGAKVLSVMGRIAPRLTETFLQNVTYKQQQSTRKGSRLRPDGLHAPRNNLRERGNYEGQVIEYSSSERSLVGPLVTGVLLSGAAFALSGFLDGQRRSSGVTGRKWPGQDITT